VMSGYHTPFVNNVRSNPSGAGSLFTMEPALESFGDMENPPFLWGGPQDWNWLQSPGA
jgi:hypothetical protein